MLIWTDCYRPTRLQARNRRNEIPDGQEFPAWLPFALLLAGALFVLALIRVFDATIWRLLP
jgi:hypothetical protein